MKRDSTPTWSPLEGGFTQDGGKIGSPSVLPTTPEKASAGPPWFDKGKGRDGTPPSSSCPQSPRLTTVTVTVVPRKALPQPGPEILSVLVVSLPRDLAAGETRSSNVWRHELQSVPRTSRRSAETTERIPDIYTDVKRRQRRGED